MVTSMFKKLLLFLIIFFFVIGCITYLWLHKVASKTFLHRTEQTNVQYTSVSDRLHANVPVDILLLGYGGAGHDGPYLTDSIMDVHIDPKTKNIFLISVPRDIWVKIPTTTSGGQYSKINAAYAIGLDDTNYPNKPNEYKGDDGGGRLSEAMVSQVTGTPVEYFAGIDFNGFKKTIDALGGVDVNVETTFDDFAYPVEDIKDTSCGRSADDIQAFTATVSAEQQIWDYFPCRYTHVHFSAGITHMDGATALTYARSRHSAQDGSDFGRAKRQRNLLIAVKQKVLSVGFISHMMGFMNSLGDDVRTDLTPNDLTTLVSDASTLQTYQIHMLALTDQNYLVDTVSSDGQDILAPEIGIDNWADVHTWLSDAFAGKPEPISAIVQVENGTKQLGLGETVSQKLNIGGLTTRIPANASNRNIAKTSITVFTDNLNPSDMTILKRQFPALSFTTKVATSSAYNVLVVLGQDYLTPSPTSTH